MSGQIGLPRKMRFDDNRLIMIQETERVLRECVLNLEAVISPEGLWAHIHAQLPEGAYELSDPRAPKLCAVLLRMFGWRPPAFEWTAEGRRISTKDESKLFYLDWVPGAEWQGLRVVQALRDAYHMGSTVGGERVMLRGGRGGR